MTRLEHGMDTIEHLMIELCGHQMSYIMLHQSHPVLDMTVEGKMLGQKWYTHTGTRHLASS